MVFCRERHDDRALRRWHRHARSTSRSVGCVAGHETHRWPNERPQRNDGRNAGPRRVNVPPEMSRPMAPNGRAIFDRQVNGIDTAIQLLAERGHLMLPALMLAYATMDGLA